MCGVYGTGCPCTAQISNSNLDSLESKFTQAMNASELAFPVATSYYYYSTPYPSANASADKDEEEVIAGEKKSREIKRVRNYFSTPFKQWQNRQPESSVDSLMTLARTTMVESGLRGRFWFSAAMAGKDSLNVTYKEHIKTAPYHIFKNLV
jgi:hypothetical protein